MVMVKEKLRDLDLNLLIVLDALLRSGNVSRAAEELDMSQSAVSHALKRLRLQFEDQLFIRTRDRMMPTPKATEISEYIFEIMRLVRSTLLPSPSFDPETSDRALTLALGDVGDMLILPPLMRYMREHRSNGRVLSLPVSAEESVELLANGKLDIYVGIMDTSSSDILCQKLYEDRLVFISSKHSKIRDEITFDQYRSMDHVLLQSRTSSKSGQFVFEALQRSDGQKNAKIETPYIASIPQLVEEDENLLAIAPASLARYFQTVSSVNIINPKFYLPKIVINQYWHKRFTNDPFIKWSRSALKIILSDTRTFSDPTH